MSQETPNVKVLVIAGVVLEKDGKYLLIQEKKPDVYGTWNLPGGRVDVGETLEQAAKREAKEESGYDVEVGEELLLLHQTAEVPIIHSFAATITGGALKFPEDEALDAQWFTWEEVQQLNLRTPEYALGAIGAHRVKKGKTDV